MNCDGETNRMHPLEALGVPRSQVLGIGGPR